MTFILHDVDAILGDHLQRTLLSGLEVTCLKEIHLVLTSDYLSPNIDPVAAILDDSDATWMLARAGGTATLIGPGFGPRFNSCLECLRRRLSDVHLLRTSAEISDTNGNRTESVPANRPELRQACIEFIRCYLEGMPPDALPIELDSSIIEFDTIALSSGTHFVISHPGCTRCGHRLRFARRKIHATSNRQRTTSNRIPFSTCVSSLTGIISHLVRHPGNLNEKLFYVYRAFPDWSTVGRNERLSPRAGRFASAYGTASVKQEAKVKAIAEAIERYSVCHFADEPHLACSQVSLGEAAINPALLMGYSSRQYETRASWNRRNYPTYFVPELYDPRKTVDWSPVRSLTNNELFYVPSALCYLNFHGVGGTYFRSCSTGCAAGETYDDAIERAFLELVERDAASIWWYNRVARPAIDPNSMSTPFFDDVRNRLGDFERSVWLLDITSDLGIPTVVAVSRVNSTTSERLLYGFGCSFDVHIAVEKALTELLQTITGIDYLSRVRPNIIPNYVTQWLNTASTSTHSFLAPSEERPVTTGQYLDASLGVSGSGEEGVKNLVQHLTLDAFVCDLTRPELNIPVVRVFIPGFCHLWPRLGSRRLYTVPVNMGWISSAREQCELNQESPLL